MRIGFLVLVLLVAFAALSQVPEPLDGIYFSVSTLDRKSLDLMSVSRNPSAIGRVKNASAVVYHERRFLLPELSPYHLILALPIDIGAFSFVAAYQGNQLFHQQHIKLSYARPITKDVDLGVAFGSGQRASMRYAKTRSIDYELGLLVNLAANCRMGLHIINPFSIGSNNSEPTSVFTLGIGYEISENVFCMLQVKKERTDEPGVETGICYRFTSRCESRLGISTLTGSPFFGFGYQSSFLRVDLVTSYHPVLGVSPGIAISFRFKKQQHEN